MAQATAGIGGITEVDSAWLLAAYRRRYPLEERQKHAN